MSAPKPYTEEDVQLVARWFREERYRDPEYNARDVLDALGEAGRLQPAGERAQGMCGAEAPTLFGAGLDLHVCELLAGHNGWHARRNDDGSWMNWTDGAALTTDELDSTNGG